MVHDNSLGFEVSSIVAILHAPRGYFLDLTNNPTPSQSVDRQANLAYLVWFQRSI